MKDASGYIRSWLFTALNGTVSYGGVVVPVYSFVPKGTSMPYMVIGEQSFGTDEGTKGSRMYRHRITLEIWTAHTGNDASYVPANTIGDSALQLVRTATQPTGLTGFTCVVHQVVGGLTDRMPFENETIIYKSYEIELIVTEN